ncbi:MAG: hypothetical protein OEY34_07470 [Cyclobacteriaceae bacterium]|nr:hypothetical protein [Cyclobacteriaceae bacterium]
MDKINQYSEQFSKVVVDRFFATNDSIDGNSILALTEIKQINLLIVKNLMISWKSELKKLESPYFNYDNPTVKKALTQFGNILSRNIEVKIDDFLPLVNQSVTETITLIFSPYTFYNDLLRSLSENGKIKTEYLRENSKYIKVNKTVINKLIEKCEGVEKVEIELAEEYLESIFKGDITPDDTTSFEEQFYKICSVQIPELSEEVVEDKKETANQKAKDTPKNIAEDLEIAGTTLNDKYGSKEKTSLADMHQKKKIDNIRNSLTINQKFMFTNSLFQGDASDFNRTLDVIESMSNYEEACSFLVEKYNWNTEEEETEEFFHLIAKRFGNS